MHRHETKYECAYITHSMVREAVDCS